MPRGPREAKGLLLAAIRDPNPVIFFEPKALYRAAVEEVPEGDFELPLSKAEILRAGSDVTVVGCTSRPLPLPPTLFLCRATFADDRLSTPSPNSALQPTCDRVVGGSQLRVLERACDVAEKEHGISCELIDLRTLLPADYGTIEESVRRTGRLVVSHEAPRTGGFAAEVASTIAERCFLELEAPVQRVCGSVSGVSHPPTPQPPSRRAAPPPDRRRPSWRGVVCTLLLIRISYHE